MKNIVKLAAYLFIGGMITAAGAETYLAGRQYLHNRKDAIVGKIAKLKKVHVTID